MATILLRQSGQTTIAAGSASNTATLSTALTNTSKTVIFYNARSNYAGGILARCFFGGTITNTTTLTFTRGTAASTVNLVVEWQVIEYSAGVTAQRGTAVFASSSTSNVTISSVTTTKAWPMIAYISTDTGEADLVDWVLVKANISSSTNLALTKANWDHDFLTVYWQVVEYDNCTVASYTKSITGTGTSTTQTITSVTTASTILFDTFTLTAGENAEFSENIVRLSLTDSTTVTYTRYIGDGDITESHLTYVVSFSDTVSVQRATQRCTSTTTTSVTITSIDVDRSISKINSLQGYLTTAEIAAWQANLSMFSTHFGSSTNLTLTRATGASPQAAIVSWEIISWAAVVVTSIKRVFLFY